MAGLPRFPNPNQIQEPLSKSIERELRWQFPRLQIKETESVGQKGHKKEATAELKLMERAQNLEKTTSLANGQNHDTLYEKIFVSSTKITAPAPDDVSHKMHGAQAPEAIYELEGGVPEPSSKPMISDCQLASQMLANLPDKVVLSLLHQVCSLDDLFRFAIITKQFYHVFKQHELELIKSAVFTMSPPAWELREMSPPWSTEWQILVDPDTPVPEYTPALYLQRYAQDIYTLTQLKLLILTRCETFLRPETIRGLSGRDDARAGDIDEAFWRIWTFCRIFGCGKSREGDIVGQVDWLNGGVMAVSDDKHGSAASVTEPFGMYNVLFEPPSGFGRGNGGGLSNDQLYNMTEIWTCLGVLLQPIHGRCKEAREAGIFAGHQVAEHDNARAETVLEEWTYYILTLGPSAVLNMASIGPGGCAAAFRRAQLIGLTKWERSESGTSRSSFLKEAVSKAYKPRCDSPQQGSSQIPQGISRSFGHTTSPSAISSNAVRLQLENDRRRQAVYAEQLRNQRKQPQKAGCHSFADERPISKYSFIMSRLESIPYEQRPPLPSPATMESYVARAPNAQCPPKPLPIYQPQVRDPVDQAMDMMVRELGFKEDDAKWALKITDTGEGINANAAVSLLLREHQNFQRNDNVVSMRAYRSNSLLSSVISSPESMNSVWRWA
ncbi:uncharacterized protein BDW43DRAFT_297385 [Aspergillus alliaceus]|uniref:uncharacterized protein n=1 Tax=Petromyces alliaceus TaxID=209559 RepID=UPI0012A76362|nr:uncharacterized protein BDW43DRAFT_297385 [Aspergillus alliaceus]KAB8237702.1 hypothetical protein BDW43DRAFT_297385 [Aspergillus alliaceus]